MTFRPTFDAYKSPRKYRAEQAAAARQAEEARAVEINAQRRQSYGLVIANLPLLEKYVEKSPVERIFPSSMRTKMSPTVGGWSLTPGLENLPHKRTFVVTENDCFGYATVNRERNTYSLLFPEKINENNFLNYAMTCDSTVSHGTLYVPSPPLIKHGLQELLSEAGIEPIT